MADEQLRLQASVVDGFSAPLRKLNALLSETGKHPAGRWLKSEWQGVATSFDKITTGLNTGLAPALSRIGVTSLGVTGAFAGIGVAIKQFAGQTQALSIFSREIGMSTKQLREMKAVGEHFGVGWDAAQGSLKQFAGNLDGLRRRWGETYGALRGMNLGSLAEDLAKAPNMQAAVDTALEGLKGIANPVYRRKVAELLFGSDQWATIASELTPRVRKEIQSMLSDLPKGSEEAAAGFNLGLTKIQLGIDELRNQAIGPLMKDVNEALNALNKPEVYAGIKREWDGLTSGVKGFLHEVSTLKEIWGALSSGDVQGTLKGLRKADGASGPMARKLAPLPGDEALNLQDRIKDLTERRAHNDKYFAGRVPERQAELTREIEKLTLELKRLQQNGGATVQQQSFDGSGGGGFGGLIHKANIGFGGAFGGGGRGIWSFNGRTWDRREDSSGRGGRDVYLPPNAGSAVPRISPAIPRQLVPGGPRSLFGDLQPAGRGGDLLGLIARAEGTTKRGYNDSFAHQLNEDLTGKSIAEIQQIQRRMRGSSAIGKYQFMRATLGDALKQGVVGPDDKFDGETQDKLARWRIAFRQRRAARGGFTMDKFQNELAKEWASFPTTEGRGYYPGQRASVPGTAVRSAAGDYLKGPPSRVAEAPTRSGDSMMGRAFGPGGVAAGSPKMTAEGSVKIELGGGLEKMPARVSMDGLFTDVKVSRGRQMEEPI